MRSFLQILTVAIIVDVFISFVIGVSASFSEREPLYFIYVGILLFASLFFPLVIASALYHFIATRMNNRPFLVNLFLQSISLFVIIQFSLALWALLEVLSDFSSKKVISHYNQEFGKMFWLTFFVAFAIPLINLFLNRRKKPKDVKLDNPKL